MVELQLIFDEVWNFHDNFSGIFPKFVPNLIFPKKLYNPTALAVMRRRSICRHSLLYSRLLELTPSVEVQNATSLNSFGKP